MWVRGNLGNTRHEKNASEAREEVTAATKSTAIVGFPSGSIGIYGFCCFRSLGCWGLVSGICSSALPIRNLHNTSNGR